MRPEEIAPSLGGVSVLKEVRGWERPSDHVPVLASLA
jgi:exonuclease III